MIEGFRKLTPEQVIDMAERYPWVKSENGCCNQEDGEGYACTLLPGHPGTLHIVHFSAHHARVGPEHNKYVPLHQWFS